MSFPSKGDFGEMSDLCLANYPSNFSPPSALGVDDAFFCASAGAGFVFQLASIPLRYLRFCLASFSTR